MSMPRSGKIQETNLADILESLCEGKATGVLSLRRERIEKSVYLKDGNIIFATSSEAHDRLGDVLVKKGKLTQEKLDYAVTLYRKNAGLKKLGAILVENGIVSPKELFSGLKIQVKEIIFSLFLWRDGEYWFEERLPADAIQLPINVQELIAEIIERIRREA